jgi:hypothetical protein
MQHFGARLLAAAHWQYRSLSAPEDHHLLHCGQRELRKVQQLQQQAGSRAAMSTLPA